MLQFSLNFLKRHCVKSIQVRSFFWSIFSRMRTKYGDILRISPYSVQIRENKDQKKLRIWTLFRQCVWTLKIGFFNYADDTNTCNCKNTFVGAISDLETTIYKIFNWFCYNNFNVNPSKFHLFLSLFNLRLTNIKISSIEGSPSKKIFRSNCCQ